MTRRERLEKVAFARFLTRLVHASFRVPVDVLDPILKDYAETVYHTKYAGSPETRKKQRREKADRDILSKVAKLSASDDDPLVSPEYKKKQAGR